MAFPPQNTSPPGPPAIPFFDPFFSILRFRATPVDRLLALQPRYGDLFTVASGSTALVCALGAEYNRIVLTQPELFQHEGAFPFRTPKGTAFERFGTSLVLLNGDTHRRHRRLLQPAFQRSALDRYVQPIVDRCAHRLDRWPRGVPVDAVVLLRELTLAAVVSALFGVDLSEHAHTLGRLAVAQLAALSSPLTLLFPLSIPGTPFYRLMWVCQRLEDELKRLIAERRGAGTLQGDVLSILLHAHDGHGGRPPADRAADRAVDPGSDVPLTDTELIGELNTLFVAGHETTSNTLSWTLFLLTQHPAVWQRLDDEIQSVLAGRSPTADDIPRMPYLGHVIDESMRLLPATPVLFMRVNRRPVTLGGYTLPAGSKLALSPLSTQRDPTVFPQPGRFRPERWESIHPTPYQYLPFGAGPRMCLGAALATQTLRLMLPMILQRFEPRLTPGAHIDAVVRGITCCPHPGLPVTLHPRHVGRPLTAPQPGPVRGNITRLVDLTESTQAHD